MFKTLALSVLFGAAAVAAETGGSSAFVNLQINKSARSCAMGGAGTALASDESFISLNPATLAQVGENRLSAGHLLLNGTGFHSADNGWTPDQGRFADFASLVLRTHGVKTSVFIDYLQDDGYIAADEYGHADPARQFSIMDLGLGLAAAYSLGPVDLGLSVRELNQRIFNQQANAVVVDLGAAFPHLWRNLRAGLALKDLALYVDAFDQVAYWPSQGVMAGLAWEEKLSGICTAALLLDGQVFLDANVPWSERFQNFSPYFPLGLELAFYKKCFVRAGYTLNHDVKRLSAGVGLKLSFLSADYAFVYNSSDLGSTNLFTLSYLFDK